MSITKPTLSLGEKLDLFPAGLSIVATFFFSGITGFFRNKEKGARKYHTHLMRALFDKILLRLSFKQVQYLNDPTDTAYRKWLKSKGVAPASVKSVPLKNGAVGYWIGNRSAKNVIVYYHGGGFALPATTGHLTFYSSLLGKIANTPAHDHDTALFFVSYRLTPHTVYPTQLASAVDALRFILSTDETGISRSPANIFLGGDSAGGNLALTVLAHLSHPHPEIEQIRMTKGEKLAGVFAIAPWVIFDTDPGVYPSMRENEKRDLITPALLDKFADNYLPNGRASGDSWSESLRAPGEWWSGFKAKRLLITVGGDEILRSPIETFVEKLRAAIADGAGEKENGDGEVSFLIGERETHVPMVFANERDTQQGAELERWLVKCLDGSK